MTGLSDADWRALLDLAAEARRVRGGGGAEAFRRRLAEMPPLFGVYASLIGRIAAGPLVVAQVGQSLDARIATEGGHSHYINGPEGLDHLHRLRALADAVVVGATTVDLDDPQLTTRRVPGPSPTRVVLDPQRRLPASRRMFDDRAATLRVVRARRAEAGDLAIDGPADAPIPPAHLLGALAGRGLATVLVEGGGVTISAFLRAGCLHRLHVVVAPMLVGPGREAFRLPALDRLDGALRFRMAAHPLGSDVLLDCDLEAAG